MRSKEREVYWFVVDYITEHGYAPTNREIGNGVGLKSTATVNFHMNKLFEQGWLETDNPQSSRAIRVCGSKVFMPKRKEN